MLDQQDREAIVFRGVVAAKSKNTAENIFDLANRIENDPDRVVNDSDLAHILTDVAANNSVLLALGELVSQWDDFTGNEASAITNTAPGSTDRRNIVMASFGITPETSELFLKMRPVVDGAHRAIVISEGHRGWYTPEERARRNFYWTEYKNYLISHKSWDVKTVASIDRATNAIMEHLANPTAADRVSARGLVVGHVQSGKTANFTGLAAKAIDAGYRLVIILTGTHESLRKQTQRRIDMELLGRANILMDLSERDASDTVQGEYLEDNAWHNGDFTTLSGRPPTPSIERLTSFSRDYLGQHANALRYKANDPRPLYDPEVLFDLPAKIIIMKKETHALGSLLKHIQANQTRFDELPVLIIDDESDQAGINTVKPDRAKAKNLGQHPDEPSRELKKKGIHKKIYGLLKHMPRVQYVGYTATPFANVFVDPDDYRDMFPKDFILALEEPHGYMGVSTFIDPLDDDQLNNGLSNSEAYVRKLVAVDSDKDMQDAEMKRALADFVLSGAIKLYRQDQDPDLARGFQHHTMLVHEDTKKEAHRKLASRIITIWSQAQWHSAEGLAYLKKHYANFEVVIADRKPEGIPEVESFDQLEPYLYKCIGRVESRQDKALPSAENIVLVINGDADLEERLHFDKVNTWKILVGGAMLSRGFTIEGLTISYFRRSPRAHDTLLQMARWFGFRPGYSDLVRIYLATNTTIGRQLVDMYEAFCAIMMSEEAFRKQLSQYISDEDGHSTVRPTDVTPLVYQYLPWLKPTSPARMRNAQLSKQATRTLGFKEPSWQESSIEHNWEQSLSLIRNLDTMVKVGEVLARGNHPTKEFDAHVGVVNAQELMDAVMKMDWMDGYYDRDLRPKIASINESIAEGLLTDFLFIIPQRVNRSDAPRIQPIDNMGDFTLVERTRFSRGQDDPKVYEEFTQANHRRAAEAYVASKPEVSLIGLDRFPSKKTRAVALGYVFPEKYRGPGETDLSFEEAAKKQQFVLGLTLYLPQRGGFLNEKGKVLAFRV